MTGTSTGSLTSLDFSRLSRDLSLLEHESPDSEVLAVLKEGLDMESYKENLSKDLKQIESGIVSSYLQNSDSLLTLYRETQLCDNILSSMEATLSKFGDSLRGVSDDIRQLQHKSEELSNQLKSRTDTQEKLIEFIDSVIVSPDLVSTICDEEDCGSDKYLTAVDILGRKLRAHSLLPSDLPSVVDSGPEMARLKNKAVLKIREYIVNKVSVLKQPRASAQTLQQNVLIKLRPLMKFLREIDGGMYYTEIMNFYASALSRFYTNQFKTFVQTLTKLQLEVTAAKTDLVGTLDSVPPPTGGLKLSGSFSAVPGAKGNVFSISGGRDRVVKEDLEADAIVVSTDAVPTGPKYYPETLLRSHQKLLSDTAASEYAFLVEFFDLGESIDDHQRVFDLVMNKTLSWFTEYISTSLVKDSFDPVGLMLSVRIVEFFQDMMINRRKIPVLDSYFEALLSQMRVRLRLTIELNTDSLKRIDVKKLPVPAVPTPFYITRRFAEFSSAILFVKSALNEDAQLTQIVDSMVSVFDSVLTALSKRIAAAPDQSVFLLNNIDLILTIYHERGLGASSPVVQRYEERMNGLVSGFIEQKLGDHFGPLIKLTLEQERQIAAGGAVAPSSHTVQEMERIVVLFQQTWKAEIAKIQKETLDSFSNYSTATEILKNSMTQLLLYYTRFQKVVTSRVTGAAWVRQIVPSGVIMAEIKQIQNMF